MRRHRSLACTAFAAVLLALSAPLASAAAPTAQPADEAAADAQQAAASQAAEPDAAAASAPDTFITRRQCLQSTGSVITAVRNRRAAREGKPAECAPAFGRVYTQDDLRGTGGTDLGDILRTLDPSIR